MRRATGGAGRPQVSELLLKIVFAAVRLNLQSYEHQNPRARVAELIGLHLPGVGLPVVPQSRQIQ